SEIMAQSSLIVLVTRAGILAAPMCITCFWPTRCWGRHFYRCTMSPFIAVSWRTSARPFSRADLSSSLGLAFPGGGRTFKMTFCFPGKARPPTSLTRFQRAGGPWHACLFDALRRRGKATHHARLGLLPPDDRHICGALFHRAAAAAKARAGGPPGDDELPQEK